MKVANLGLFQAGLSVSGSLILRGKELKEALSFRAEEPSGTIQYRRKEIQIYENLWEVLVLL